MGRLSRVGCHALGRLAGCRRGSVAPIFAAVVCSAIALAGFGMDYGSASLVRSAYQSALDAAMVATDQRPELVDDELQHFARRQFEANLSVERLRLLREFTVTRDADGLSITAEATVPMPFASLLGLSLMDVRAEAAIRY